MATKDAKIRITAQDKTKASIHQVKRNLAGLKASAIGVSSALTGLAPVAGIAGLASLAKSAINAGSAITDMAVATNTGIEEIQALNYAAQEAGASQEQMANLLVRVQKSAADAKRGLSTAKEAFKLLNISVDEFIDMSPEQMLEQVGKALVDAGDDTRAYGAALDLLGTRNAPKLMEVMKRLGSEGFDSISSKAKQAGQVMTDELARDMDRTADALEEFGTRVTNISALIVSKVLDIADAFGTMAGAAVYGLDDKGLREFARTQLREEGAFAGLKGRGGATQMNKLIDERVEEILLIEARANAKANRQAGRAAEANPATALSKTAQTATSQMTDLNAEILKLNIGMNNASEAIAGVETGFENVQVVAGEATTKTRTWMDDAAGAVTGLGYALEDGLVNAAKNGKAAFGDMAQFILAEIQRILIRSLILRPLFGAIGGFIGDNPVGNAFSSSFGGGKAGGGMVTGGKSYMVGERGPEMVTMGGNGYVTPNHKMGGDVYNIDARGADKEGLRNLENAILALNGSIENRAIAAVRNASTRKPSYI
jgi:hypothetical protein